MTTVSRMLTVCWRWREFGLAILIVLITLVVVRADSRFLAAGNLKDVLVRGAPAAIVACGVMLVVVTAEVDISVGSLMALLAAALGIMVSRNEWNWPAWSGIAATLLLGTGMGLATGALVAFGKVPSIIVTLGMLTSLRGLTTLLMRGGNIDGLPAGLVTWTKEGMFGVPLSVWVAAAVVLFTGLLLTHTPVGRRLYALGSSSHAAQLAGLSERQLKLFVFAYTGFLTAVATLVEVPRLPKIEAGIGSEFELLVITCVVVGGVSMSGGRGRLTGVVLAVLLLTLVRPVLTFLDVGEAGEKWTKAVQGAFILLAVVGDSLANRTRERPL
jgi:ribose/xylose/arabinose/galactoside ABC-type transport system permease subunit